MPRSNNGPRLVQNDRGVWEIRWTEGARRSMRCSTRETDLKRAQQAFVAWLSDRNRDEAEREALTLGPALESYITDHVEENVVDRNRQRVIQGNLLAYFGADRVIKKITAADMLGYQRARREGQAGAKQVKSNGTLRRELNMFLAAMNFAVKHRKLPPADVPYVKLPPAPPPRDFWLNETEMRQLLGTAADMRHSNETTYRGFLFLMIALHTAARKRAIETLRWDQVDLGAGLIHFLPPGARQTKKRRVPVPISDDLRQALQERRQARPNDMYVFSHPGSTIRGWEPILEAAAELHGNERFKLVYPHALRHTFATLAARRGVDLWQIAGILGDNLATVQKNYLHHCPDHLRKAVNF